MPAGVDVVWERIADHPTWPQWFTALSEVRPGAIDHGLGGGRSVVVNRITIEEEFTAWEPGRHFAFSVVKAPRLLASLAESVELDALADGRCVVTYRQGIEPARGFGWFWRLSAMRMRRELNKALDALATQVRPTA